ncbi:MAG: acyl-CoA dehydrogenase family protein [Deltaproteobacteria bacterium]|nr:acyl-CoA dehydrogenase family protein [Deltaproteobacteria bacterium]MBW1931127.1 acyl-CoA dehydrogenase family protein [Deltaproteobacteria bacterium]MBW2025514.1 acyl-CoA dehydrogenase family protein [Deltaproteobacteria bacterium]
MEIMLSPEDLAYRHQCKMYARGELAELAERFGEINYVPEALRLSLARAGFFKYLIPEKYGGYGLSAVRVCLAREVLAGTYGPADVTLAMQGLGSYPIVLAGTDAQKQKFLPSVASGERLTTFALTEMGAGSDVSSLETVAKPIHGGYCLSGRKRFISNGYSADMAIIFAKTRTADNPKAISAFVIEKGTKGYEVDRRLELISAHDIVSLKLDRAVLPKENLIGKIGDGFKLAMQTLNFMRMTVGAAAVGMGQAALDEALAYAMRRVQFGSPISRQQAIKFKIAEMATALEAARLLVYRAAIKKDHGAPDVALAASMAKLYATEAAWRVIDQAVQIHGGVGVMKNSKVERLYREVRPLRIYEGTSEIQKLIISRAVFKAAEKPK